MVYQNDINSKRTYGIWIVAFIYFFILSACGGGSDGRENSAEHTSTETGAIAFRVVWADGEAESALNRPQSPSGDVCEDYGIDTIACNIYNSSGAIVKSQSWTCSTRSGQMSGVPTGSGMWLTLDGIVSGTPQWRGQSGTFTVATNEITTAGSVTVDYIGKDQQRPGVQTTSPVNALNDVSLNSVISVQFTEDVVSASVIPAFTLMAGATEVSGAARYEAASRTVTFTPGSDFLESTTYTATVASTIEDKAGNQMGSDYVWSFTTTALNAPSVTTQAATGVTQNTAILNALVNANGFATTYHFEYGPDQNYGFATAIQNLVSGHDPVQVHADISGLDSGGTYQYRVVATNAGGTSNGLNRAFTSVAVWAKTFLTRGLLDNHRNLIQQTADGGYIVASTIEVTGSMNDFVLLKLAADGSVTWQKTYGQEKDDKPFAILQTADGGYVIVVKSNVVANDMALLKLDASGEIITGDWYAGPHAVTPAHFQQTMDGGFIIAGDAINLGEYRSDLWVLKLNSNGVVEWSNAYGALEDEEGAHIKQTSDGGYIVAGSTSSYGAGLEDGWLLKLDTDGSVIWQRAYGGIGNDYLRSVQQTVDGGYILAGGTLSHGAGGMDIWILKLTVNGDIVWQRTYGGEREDFGTAVQQTSDGGYIVTGDTHSFSESVSESDILVLKLTADGAIDWQKLYGGYQDEISGSILQTHDGGFIMTGNTVTHDPLLPYFGSLWVLKLDQGGALGCGMGRDPSVSIFTPSAVSNTTTASETNASVDGRWIPFREENATVSVETQCP